MGKRKDSRYKAGTGYIKGTLDDLNEESQKFFNNFKGGCGSSKSGSSKIRKKFDFFSKSRFKFCGSRSKSKLMASLQIGIYIGLFLFLVLCGLRFSAIIIVMLLIFALEFL
ncbi:MAG: hypothetical protein ABRQ25_06245 [Clostridiaceae bacterium]